VANKKHSREPFNVSDFLRPAGEDLESTLHALIHPEPSTRPGSVVPEPEKARCPLRIVRLRAASQAGTQSVFSRAGDALALVIDISAPEEMLTSEVRFDANFRIVDHATNRVRRNCWSKQLRLRWGTNFWISQGNNWGPDFEDYTTPEKWGLGRGLYIFQAVLELQSLGTICSCNNGLIFRVR
jgi:hypothetical protein